MGKGFFFKKKYKMTSFCTLNKFIFLSAASFSVESKPHSGPTHRHHRQGVHLAIHSNSPHSFLDSVKCVFFSPSVSFIFTYSFSSHSFSNLIIHHCRIRHLSSLNTNNDVKTIQIIYSTPMLLHHRDLKFFF